MPTYQSVVLGWSAYMLSDRTGANWILVLPMITSRRSCSEVVTCRAPPVSVSASYCPDGFLYFGVPVSAKKSSLREGFPAPAPPMTPAFNVVWGSFSSALGGHKKVPFLHVVSVSRINIEILGQGGFIHGFNVGMCPGNFSMPTPECKLGRNKVPSMKNSLGAARSKFSR